MSAPRIYTPQSLACGETVELETQASHHLHKVLRMQAGDALILFNGNGSNYPAKINVIRKKSLLVSILEQQHTSTESPLAIHLGIAISKGDKMDFIMQKATELGVQAITPLFTERTEVKLQGERREKKQQHWQQVIISACEQSGRCQLPTLDTIQPLANWLNTVDTEKKFVLHHRSTQPLSTAEQTASIALLIGPEGGLSKDEISAAEQQHFQALSLGPRVLRTETAPLAVISILQFLWGDF